MDEEFFDMYFNDARKFHSVIIITKLLHIQFSSVQFLMNIYCEFSSKAFTIDAIPTLSSLACLLSLINSSFWQTP